MGDDKVVDESDGPARSVAARKKPNFQRWLSIVVDCSEGMREADYAPNRLLYVFAQLRTFLYFFFEQNPLSQVQVIQTCDGAAATVSEMSGNPEAHVQAIDRLLADQGYGGAGGRAMAGGGRVASGADERAPADRAMALFSGSISIGSALALVLQSQKSLVIYGQKEVLFVLGALRTQDSNSVFGAVRALRQSAVRVSTIHLAAEVQLCKVIAAATGGVVCVPLNELHLLALLRKYGLNELRGAARSGEEDAPRQVGRAVLMGFPSVRETRSGAQVRFACPQCRHSLVDRSLPTFCPVCNLTLVKASSLSRSYYQWFQSKTIAPVSLEEEARLLRREPTVADGPRCVGCERALSPTPPSAACDAPLSRPALASEQHSSDLLDSFLSRHLEQWLSDADRDADPPVALDAPASSTTSTCSRCGTYYCSPCAKLLANVLHLCLRCTERVQL